MSSLELRDVTVTARGKALVENVSLSLHAGEFVALLGPNGAGKTTLLRAALGLVPCRGEALLDGRPVRDIPARERAGLAAWLPQQSHVAEPVTVYEFVKAARYRFAETSAEAEREVVAALTKADVLEHLHHPVTELSGGELQRVGVAALIAQDAPLLLLDEPANHMDPSQQIGLYRLIAGLWRDGRGVLCITHDVNMLRHVGSGDVRVVGMADGRAQFETSFSADNLPEHVGRLFNVRMDVVQSNGQRLLVPQGTA
ncbi:MAG: ABC transporter ATP-binding protein [Planctomycetes bacterium]|nr:ABC transporter ATP-binding protein [Planctomycetota bacterium]